MLIDQSTERLTCLAESAGQTLLWNGLAIAYRLYRDGLTDTLYFSLDFAAASEETLATNHFRVTYNGESAGFSTIEGFSSPTCMLTYADAVRSLSLRLVSDDDTLTVDGTARRELSCAFAWYDSLPVLHWIAHFYAHWRNYVTWSVTAPEGRYGTPGKAVLYVRRQGESAFTARTSANLGFDLRGWYIGTEEADLGAAYYFTVSYTTHAEKQAGSPWLTRNTLTTPVAVMDRDGSYPLPPTLSHSAVMRGNRVRLRWAAPDDPLYTLQYFDLYRAVSTAKDAAPAWTLLYSGRGTQFSDTPPEDAYVRYKLRGRVGGSSAEAVTDTGWCVQASSNLYVCANGRPVPAAAVYIGSRTAYALGYVGEKR